MVYLQNLMSISNSARTNICVANFERIEHTEHDEYVTLRCILYIASESNLLVFKYSEVILELK
jgi:hypothetical protein